MRSFRNKINKKMRTSHFLLLPWEDEWEREEF